MGRRAPGHHTRRCGEPRQAVWGGTPGWLTKAVCNTPRWCVSTCLNQPQGTGWQSRLRLAPACPGTDAALRHDRLSEEPRARRNAPPPLPSACPRFVSILTPVRDVSDDVFEGYRPHKLPNGSWPQQVLDWEFQGKDLPARWAQRVAGDTPAYVTPEFSKSFGMRLVRPGRRAARGWRCAAKCRCAPQGSCPCCALARSHSWLRLLALRSINQLIDRSITRSPCAAVLQLNSGGGLDGTGGDPRPECERVGGWVS